MVLRSRNSLGRLLLALLCALVASGPLCAEPDLDDLKKEITKLEAQLPGLEKKHNDAVKDFNANKAAQAKAEGKELAALKAEGMKLSRDVASAADEVLQLRRKIADKQGEIRETAAAHTLKRINAAGNVNVRIKDAIFAMEEWEKSLGPLPEVPQPQDLSNFADPMLKAAAKKDDRKRIKAYDDWAKAEEKRIKEEIETADKLVGKNKVVEDADDGGLYLDEARKLKKTLEKRQKQVKKLRDSARDALKELD